MWRVAPSVVAITVAITACVSLFVVWQSYQEASSLLETNLHAVQEKRNRRMVVPTMLESSDQQGKQAATSKLMVVEIFVYRSGFDKL